MTQAKYNMFERSDQRHSYGQDQTNATHYRPVLESNLVSHPGGSGPPESAGVAIVPWSRPMELEDNLGSLSNVCSHKYRGSAKNQ